MIKKIEFSEKYHGLRRRLKKIALFDDKDITEKRVRKLIRESEYNDFVIICYEEQFNNVFKSLKK